MENTNNSSTEISMAVYSLLQCRTGGSLYIEAVCIEDIVTCLQHFGGNVEVLHLEAPCIQDKFLLKYILSAENMENDAKLNIQVSTEMKNAQAAFSQSLAFGGETLKWYDKGLAYSIIDNAFFIAHEIDSEDEE